MTEKTNDQEQSMEEILASIRKIISEEEGTEVSKPSDKDDVLILNDVVEQDDGISANTDDILELTEVVSDPSMDMGTQLKTHETFDDQLKIQRPEHNSTNNDRQTSFVNEVLDPSDVEISTTNNFVEEANELEIISEDHRGLVDVKNAELVNASLSKLSAINKNDPIEFAPSLKTDDFDDQAYEIMRPMIKKWLDENLAELVEKLVRDEIKRLTQISSRQNK